MAKSAEVKEVGIIGQMYENRTNKKVGVLESRDEKFKTLMFRDENGNSFNVNFSTFKSTWRKYNGDKVIQLSSQVESQREEEKHKEAEEKKKAAKTVEKSVTAPVTKRVSHEDSVKYVMHIKGVLEKMVEGTTIRVAPGAKGSVSLCLKNRHMVEFWPKCQKGMIKLCINDSFFKAYSSDWKFSDSAVYHEDWHTKYEIPVLAIELFEETAQDFVNKLLQFIQIPTDNSKKEEK